MFKKEGIKQAGITLVALVVTIVILLILAGVSLNLILGNQGLVKKAKDAKANYTGASREEQGTLDLADANIDDMLGNIGKATVGIATTSKSTIDGQAYSSSNPVIPKGYIAIDTATAKWADKAVNNGLVIADATTNGNEWVWVPVTDASTLYQTITATVLTTATSALVLAQYFI
jgi:type II secretory pathway pseudopilin PulG